MGKHREFLNEVDWFVSRFQEEEQKITTELEKIVAIKEGRRKGGSLPLGKKFMMNRAAFVEELYRGLEQVLTGRE